MSTEVDNRVVSMKFDNRQFEAGVGTSLSTLDKLKRGLNLEGAAKGLDGISAAANRVSFGGMTNGIEAVKLQFSALQVMAVTALANITNSAVNAGKNLVKSFTIDPVKDGLREYETQMNAIQTILANTSTKGTTLKDVKGALAELNEYSDKTIYNFTEMAKNIGTFTAAGVALKPATAAIKGIANLAAVSGSNSEQAATAMYQLSQAMASGTVKLMDWNSVVNAGMGGEVFQNSLKETARNHGINIDKMIKREGSFRETLKDGWLSTNILTETLQKFTGDLSASQLKQMGYTEKQIAGIIKMGKMANDAATKVKTFTQLMDTLKEAAGSGWAQTWEIVLGDFEEAKKMFTNVSNVLGGMLGNSAKARNSMLKGWKDLGGRTVLIDAISIAFNNIMDVVRAIGGAFKEIFPPTTSKQLFGFTMGLKNLMSGLTLSKGALENLKSTFKGIFAILGVGVDIIKFIASAFGLVIKAIFPVRSGILAATGGFGDFLVMIHNVIERSNIFGIALNGIGKAINFVSGLLSPYIEKLKTWVKTSTLIEDSIKKIKTVFGPYIAALKEYIKTSTLIEDSIKKIQNGLVVASGGLRPVLTIIKEVFSSFSKYVKELFTGTNVFATTLNDTKQVFVDTANNTNKLSSALSKLGNIFSTIKSVIVKVVTTIKNIVTPVFNRLKEMISGLTMGDVGALLAGGGLLMFANTIRKGIKGVDEILDNFSNVLDKVGQSLKAFTAQVRAKALMTIAVAIGILAAALIVLTFIDMTALAKSLGLITVLIAELVGAMIIMNKFGGDNKKLWEKSNISGIIGLGIAILLLAASVKVLASIDQAKLEQGMNALGKLMLFITLFIQTTRGGSLRKSAGGLILFSIGLLALVGALVILSKLKPETLEQGGKALIALMTAIGVFVVATRSGDLKQSAGGLTAFAIGILILSGALAVLGKLDPVALTQGAIAIATLMTAIGYFIIETNGGDLATSGGGLMTFAIGIIILAKALSILGHMDIKSLAKGTGVILALMTAIGAFVYFTAGGDLKQSAGGIIGFAAGITILALAIKMLGDMDIKSLAKGTGAILALITAIGLFVYFTAGGDLIASSAGMIAFAVGLTILAGAVAILALINPDKIKQGVGALAALILTIGIFVKATKGADLILTGEGLKIFAIGVLVLAGALAILSALNSNKLMMASGAMSAVILSFALFVNVTKGAKLVVAAASLIIFSIAIGKLVGSLIELAKLDTSAIVAASAAISILLLTIAAFTNMTSGLDLIATSIGLVVFSGAIMVLTLAVQKLGEIPMMTLAKGIGGLTAMLIILGVTSVILAPLAPAILALSGAMVLFGIGCLTVATATFIFANALTILSQTGSAGITVLVASIRSIVALIPEIMQTIAVGIIKFAETLGNGAVTISEAFLKILTAILDSIIVATPQIMQCVGALITSFLQFLVDAVPKMVDSGSKLVIGILNGISANIANVINAAFNLVINFINGLANAIRNNSAAINNAMFNLITALVNAIISFQLKLVDAGIQIIKSVLKGIGDMAVAMFDAGVNAVKGFLKGIASMPGKIINAGADLAKGALNAAKKTLDEHSPSKAFAKIGAFGGEGFVIGLSSYASKAADTAKNVGNSAIDSMSNAIAGISDMVTNDVNAEPVIRPVMDLSNIQNGSNQLYSMMKGIDGYAVSGSVSMANGTAKSIQKHQMISEEDNTVNKTNTMDKTDIGQPARPVTLQLMLQNGKAIAEFIVDDLDGLMGNKNKITGRTVGV